MATKKQRRRREKEQRHDYMWVDDEGNEVESDGATAEPRKAAGSGSGLFQREPQAPSWRRTFKRGAIFAPIMFGTVLLLSPNLEMSQKVFNTVLIVAIFIPFSYFIDRLFYRAAMRRRGRGEQSTRRGS